MFAKRYIKLGGMWSKAIDVIGFPLMFKQQRDGCVFKLGVNVISLSEQSRVSIFVMCEVFILVNLFLCKQSVLRFGYLSIPSRLEMSALGRANSFKKGKYWEVTKVVIFEFMMAVFWGVFVNLDINSNDVSLFSVSM